MNGIDVMVDILLVPEARIIMRRQCFDGDTEIQRARWARAAINTEKYMTTRFDSSDSPRPRGKKHIRRKSPLTWPNTSAKSAYRPQRQVLRCVMKEAQPRIEELLSPKRAVKVRHIMDKLYAAGRTQAVAIRRGIVQL